MDSSDFYRQQIKQVGEALEQIQAGVRVLGRKRTGEISDMTDPYRDLLEAQLKYFTGRLFGKNED